MLYRLSLPFGLRRQVPDAMFGDIRTRLTVGMLICIQGKLLVVQSTRAKNEGLHKWWTLPQEGVEPSDITLERAMLRGMYEELDYRFTEELPTSTRVLGDFMNLIPEHRKDSGKVKQIIFIATRIPIFRIRLNMYENARYRFISSFDELDECMADVALHRIRKYMSTCEMVVHACECGFLPWHVPGEILHPSHIETIGCNHNYTLRR